MSDLDFFKPQRQSLLGVVLIFSTALFHIIRNFWVLGVYFFVRDISYDVIIYTIAGFLILLALTLFYSILSYLKFIFHIDQEKGEFVLEKGVFSSELISIPFEKIQQVNYKRNLLQRLLGVYSVAIDTAGSSEKEVEIKALTREQADLLGELLMQRSARPEDPVDHIAASETGAEETATSSDHWEHKLSFSTLVKLGLTSNYFRGLAVLTAFYFSVREQFQFTGEILPMPNLLLQGIASTVILVLLLILLGMLITMGETFIKYYNLKVKRSVAGLQVEMGLRENTRVTLKAQRVQILQVLTNPIQRKLDLYKLKISLASSQDDMQKDKITVPGMPLSIVEKITDYFYSEPFSEEETLRPHKVLLFRRISRGLLPLGIAGLFIVFSDPGFELEWWIVAGILYLGFMLIFQVLYFRTLALTYSRDFLVKYSGVWIRKKQIIQIYKLQSITLSQPIWYKKKELVNMIFHTAGGDLHFYFVPRLKAISLMNFVLFKIETTEKTWM